MDQHAPTLPDLDRAKRMVLISCDGNLRFTPRGRKFFSRIFAYYGVNLSTIKTVAQYETLQERSFDAFAAAFHEEVKKFQEAGVDAQKFLQDILDGNLSVVEISEICRKVEKGSFRH